MKNKLLFIALIFALAVLVVMNYFPAEQDMVISDSSFAKEVSLSGAESFTVMTESFPKFVDGVIDPLDVHVGDVQMMRITVEDPDGVVSVTAEIEHDIGIDTVNLKLIEGDENNGVWSGEWLVHSTHSETYHSTFTAVNTKGEVSSITMAWTDPCAPSPGGPWTLDGNCVINTVDGVDAGSAYIAPGFTLTVGSGGTFVYNDGQGIVMQGGSIIMLGSGQIKKTNLWMIDADSDGYPSSTTQLAQDTAPVNGRRRNIMISMTSIDCNTGDGTRWRNRYYDGDSDGYGVGSQVCVGNHANYVDNNNDCCDSDSNARPGQGAWFTTARTGCGGFDYNCVGGDQKRWDSSCHESYSGDDCEVGATYAYFSGIPACGVATTTKRCRVDCTQTECECCECYTSTSSTDIVQQCH